MEPVNQERRLRQDQEELGDENLTNLTTIEPIPPNGGYGWVCTAAVFLINAHTWGVNAVSRFLPWFFPEPIIDFGTVLGGHNGSLFSPS